MTALREDLAPTGPLNRGERRHLEQLAAEALYQIAAGHLPNANDLETLAKLAHRAARVGLDAVDLNLAAQERELIEAALHKCGSIGEAAQELGIQRGALSRRIAKHRIEWPRGGGA